MEFNTNLFGCVYKDEYFSFEVILDEEPEGVKLLVKFTDQVALLQGCRRAKLGLLVNRYVHGAL